MTKTKEEILSNCDNEHDKRLLEKAFAKIEKREKKIHKIMGAIIILSIVGIGGAKFINEYFFLLLLPTPFLMAWVMKITLEGAGLV